MSFGQPAWLLLLPALLLGWALFWRRSARSRWSRLLFLTLAVVAAAAPALHGSVALPVVALLVDRSASVRGDALARARTLALELQDGLRAERGALHVIGFGRGAQLLAAPGESLEALQQEQSQDESDVAAALQLAAAHIPSGARGEIVLLSDGLYTGDDPRAQTPELLRRGIRVSYIDVGSRAQDDAAITRIVAPQRVPVGQPFTVAVEVDAPRAQPARLTLRDDAGRLLADQAVSLAGGARRYAVALAAETAGVQSIVATVESEHDGRTGNNRARAVVDVIGRPRVIVYNKTRAQSALVRALASADLDVQVRDASTPLTLASLHGALAVALENMPLGELGDEADEALESYVRELGGGLLITGGRSSYAAGGYYRSRLEALLPVTLDRREELRRSRVDLGIALDRSGSMSVRADNGALKMDLANRAAGEAIQLLAPGDGVAVVAVDSAAHVMVPLQRLRDPAQLRAVLEKVLRVEPGGGGIYVGVALAVTMQELLASDAASRHLLLFADAADAEQPANYRELIERWTRAGGSLSVVALGTQDDPDAALLREIADLGGGRAYFTRDALQLPRVFAQDVMHVARKTFLEQPTHVAPARGLLSLQLTAASIPDVGGYNLTYLAPRAEAMLISDDEHHAPLAAGMQAGTGKVMAMTFEADGVFTGPFAQWSEYKTFLRSALEWVKQPENPAGLDAAIELAGNRATVTLELAPGQQLTAAPEVVLEVPGALSPARARLEWTSPSTLEATLPIESPGIVHGVVRVAGSAPIALAPVVLPYSPEFAVHAAGETGSAVLSRLALATGGGAVTCLEDVTLRRNDSLRGERELLPWLAMALLLLLLFDVAYRRALLDSVIGRVTAWSLPLRGRLNRQRRRAVIQPTAEVPELAKDPLITAKKRAQQRR